MRTAQVRLTLLIAVVAATAAAQTTIGPWTVTEYQTPDGETRPLAYTSTTRGGLADLALRCSSTAELGVELVIATGAGLQPADAYRVEVDLGVREPLLDLWTPLAEYVGVGLDDHRVDVILIPAVLQGATEAAVTITAPTGGAFTLTFDLTGLAEAMDALGCYEGAVPL